MLDLFNDPVYFFAYAASLVIAITIHEFAHALTADKLGDPTPRIQGRLTLNPLAHLDPIGTLMLLVIRFGWGKPVQFDPFNLAHPRRDAALISLAGPVSNLATAILLSLVAGLAASPLLSLLVTPLISISVVLAIFNLIPIHPLDGGKILVGLLPKDTAREIDIFLNQFGMILLLFIIFPFFGRESLVHSIISPIINFILSFLLPVRLGFV